MNLLSLSAYTSARLKKIEKKTSQNGLEVAKVGQIANRWMIGLMVNGSMVDRLNGQLEQF